MTVKQEARRLIDALPDDATWADVREALIETPAAWDDDTSGCPDTAWDDPAYVAYVRGKVEQGRKASREGRMVPHEEVMRRLGLAD